jgi:hypothetical protein
MEPKVHTYVLNVILAFVPDLVVAWAVMRLTESGWSGFWITLLALQAIYFFFWLKQALWGWLLFWIIGRQQMARYLENFFIESRFPPPDNYTLDLDDYFSGIVANKELNCDTRISAAYENGTLNGMKVSRRYSLVMQLNSASKIAFRQLRKTLRLNRTREGNKMASGKKATAAETATAETNGAEINRRAAELQILAGKGVTTGAAVTALATALGNDIAAVVMRKPKPNNR